MSEAPKKWVYRSSTLDADLQRKLDPRRFHWITPTMSGVVGYVLGVPFGIPVIEELVVVYDGAIIARPRGSAKTVDTVAHADSSARRAGRGRALR